MIRERPSRPPSKSARALATPRNYKEEVNKLLRNKNYLKLVASFTAGYGIIIANASAINQILTGYGYR